MQNLEKLTLKSCHLKVDTRKLTDTFDFFRQDETVLNILALSPSFWSHQSGRVWALSRHKVDGFVPQPSRVNLSIVREPDFISHNVFIN